MHHAARGQVGRWALDTGTGYKVHHAVGGCLGIQMARWSLDTLLPQRSSRNVVDMQGVIMHRVGSGNGLWVRLRTGFLEWTILGEAGSW